MPATHLPEAGDTADIPSGAFEEEYSGSDLTTLTGTLTIDSGASADFDHMVLSAAPGGSGGVITGAGDFSIGVDGGHSDDYLTWSSGSMTGSGSTIIGPNATLTLSGIGTVGRDLDNHGKIVWPVGGTVGFGSGVTIHNEKDGVLDFENTSGSFVPSVSNDGLLEVAAGVLSMAGTFAQSSTGTLQNDITSGTSWGKLKVSDSATLDGTVQAQLEDGYQPPSGTAFDVLDFASSSGQFATVDPQGWSAEYNPTDVELVSP